MIEIRNASIFGRLKDGPATFDQLLAAMPNESDLTWAQCREACMRAVRRLVLKGQAIDVGETFRLVTG